MQTNPESAAVEAVAYARCGQDGKPWYDDVVLPNSQEAEMWAYNLAPLYPQSALDALRGEVERLEKLCLALEAQAEENFSKYAESSCRVAELEAVLRKVKHQWDACSLDGEPVNDLHAEIKTLTKESP